MKLEAKKLVYDIDQAIQFITHFIQSKSLSDYSSDIMLRSAVERQFEIIGEALSRLKREDPELILHISDHARIIGFRNILAHGYDSVSDEIVWDIIENKLPQLRQEIEALKQRF